MPGNREPTRIELLREVEVLRARISELESPPRKTASKGMAEDDTFRTLFEEASDGILLADARTGKLLLANEAMGRMMGCEPSRLVGKGLADIHPREALPLVRGEFRRLSEEKTGEGRRRISEELPVLRCDGSTFLAEISAARTEFRGRACVFGVFRDITLRKKASEDARREGERAQLYLDTAEVVLVALDSRGKVEMINRGGCDLLGLEEKEIEGRDWFGTFVPERLRKGVRREFHRLMRGEVESVEYFENPVITAEGEERVVEWHNTLVLGPGGAVRGTLSSGRDVTDKRQAEKALRESEERFRALFQEAPLAYQALDEKGRYLEINQAFTRGFGYRKEEVVGRSFAELLAPESAERFPECFAEFKEKGEIRGVEHELVDRDGGVHLVRFDGKIHRSPGGQFLQTHCILNDITEQRKAAEALQEAEAWMEGVLQAAPVGIGVVEHRVFQTVNQHLCDMLGYTAQELMGSSARMIYPSDDEYERVGRVKYEQIARAGLGAVYTRFLRKDGEIRHVYLCSAPLSRFRSLDETVFTALDMTAEREAKEELETSEGRLRALLARLARVREDERKAVARELHDELGQQLAGLLLDLEWSLENLRPEQTERLEKRLAEARELAENANAMVHDLSSRLRPPLLDQLGLQPALRWHLEQRMARAGLLLDLDLPEEEDLGLCPEVAITSFRIVQEAVTNILKHARASAAGVRLIGEPGQLKLEVWDDGVGIDEKAQGGTKNLGLLGIRERTSALGGTLHIEKREEGGTRLAARLPRNIEKAGPGGRP